MRNAYPELPIVPYQKTSVEMGLVVAYLQSLPAPVEVKRMAYIMFRNESGNGRKGLNNNYAGIQADSGRWPAKYDSLITGVVHKGENKTGLPRLFVQFSSWQASVDMLIDRIEGRGLYIGATPAKYFKKKITTPEILCQAYIIEWVRGPKTKQPKPTEKELENFLSIYRQAVKIFI